MCKYRKKSIINQGKAYFCSNYNPKKMEYDIFISYSRKDTAIANQICEACDKVGISYFIDRQGIGGGVEFPKVLAQAIIESKIFLLLASQNAYESPFTDREITFAFNKKRGEKMLPYIIDDATLPEHLELIFASNNWRIMKQHPIETVLIDDIFRLLEREKQNVDIKTTTSITNLLKGKKRFDKWGVVDEQDNVIIPFEYDFVGKNLGFDGFNVAKTVRGLPRVGLIDNKGNSIIPLEYEFIGAFSEGLLNVKKDGKWGLIDIHGNVVIPLDYEDCGSCFDGLIAVCKESKYGFINRLQEIVIPFNFSYANDFNNGVVYAEKEDGWCGFIDKNGNTITDCQSHNWRNDHKNGIYTAIINGKGRILSKGKLFPLELDNQPWFHDGFAFAFNNGKTGLINTQGDIVLPFKYDFEECCPFHEGVAGVRKHNKWGYINSQGEVSIPFIFDDVTDFSGSHAVVMKNGKLGFINQQGNTIIPFEYESLNGFMVKEGFQGQPYIWSDEMNTFGDLIIAEKDLQWGILNRQGTIVLPFEYDGIMKITNDLYFASKNGKHGIIDNYGNIVVPFKYDYLVNEFSVDVFVAKNNEEFDLLDKQGRVILQFNNKGIHNYYSNLDFVDGFSIIAKHDGDGVKFGFIDRHGEIVIPIQYDHLANFSGGIAMANKDGKWGAIDKQGNIITPFEIETTFLSNNLLFPDPFPLPIKRNNQWGFMSIDKRMIIPCEFDKIHYFTEGYAMVMKNGEWGVINYKGEIIVPFSITLFPDGLACVCFNNKYGFINGSGGLEIPIRYDFAKDFSEGIAVVKENHQFGFINNKGQVIIPFNYDFADSFSDGYAPVSKNNLWGFIDKQGHLIIPYQYSRVVYPFKNGKALVTKKGILGKTYTFYIDKQGNRLD